MTRGSTQVILTLFIGETYLEAGVFEGTSAQSSWNRYFYLPHTSLKAALATVAKTLVEKNLILNEIYVVSRYLERLQNFRLGGSVAQYLPSGFDGNVTYSNSLATSISNSSLIISKETYDLTEAQLAVDLEQIKKVNADCDKVVVYSGSQQFSQTELIESFFKTNGFQVFTANIHSSSAEIRRSLFFAGVFGTIKELLVELTENFENVTLNIWADGKWNRNILQDWPVEQSLGLYFSGQDFLWNFAKSESKQKENQSSVTHFDFDNWETFTSSDKKSWNSPWGPLAHQCQFQRVPLAITPKHEVALDDTSRLQLIRPTTTHESGPIISGRSVRAMGLDLFAEEIIAIESLHKLIGEPDRTQTLQKVGSQFKALENGQKRNGAEISIQNFKSYAQSLIQAQVLRSSSTNTKTANPIALGQLAYLFGYGTSSAKKTKSTGTSFFWSDAIRKMSKVDTP